MDLLPIEGYHDDPVSERTLLLNEHLRALYGIDHQIRYVSKNGNDTNKDGFSWADSKLTVAAALATLPRIGTPAHAYGIIRIGPGTFIEEDTPLEFVQGLVYEGAGASFTGGTVIKLDSGANTHLFAPPSGYTSSQFTHGAVLRNMLLHGNNEYNSGAYDILQINRGGWNCSLENVMFYRACRHGILVLYNATNLYTWNCVFVRMGGEDTSGASLFLDVSIGASVNLAMFGTQIDDGGIVPIILNDNCSSLSYGIRNILINGMKFEQMFDDDHHAALVEARTPGAQASGFHIAIDGMGATKQGATNTVAMVRELSGYAESVFDLRNLQAEGCDDIFVSALTGITEHGIPLAAGTGLRIHRFNSADRRSILGGQVNSVICNYETGRYYGSSRTGSANSGTAALTADTLYFTPFYTHGRVVLDRLGVNITAGIASADIRLGIYSSDSDGMPNELLIETGALDADSPGGIEDTISLTLEANRQYWFALVASDAVTAATVAADAGIAAGFTTLVQTSPIRRFTKSHSFGALPDPAGSVVISTTNAYDVRVRAA
jgi:hypothetical protein